MKSNLVHIVNVEGRKIEFQTFYSAIECKRVYSDIGNNVSIESI